MSDEDGQRLQYQRQIDELLERRRIAQARPLLSAALAKSPDDDALRLSAAWLEWMDGQLEEAARWCQAVLQDRPSSERARYLLAGICADQGDLKQAETLYQSLLADFPDDVDYLAGLSLLLFQTVNHDRARVLAEHAISLEPGNRRALQAVFLGALLDEDRARVDAIIETVMNDDPEALQNARTLLIVLQNRRRYTEALQLARQLLRAQPDNPDIVESVIALTHRAHWSMAPLRWIDDFVQATVGLGIVGLALVSWTEAGFGLRLAGGGLVAFTLYCWVWPPVLRALIRR